MDGKTYNRFFYVILSLPKVLANATAFNYIIGAEKHESISLEAVLMFGFGIPHPIFAIGVLAILLFVGRSDRKKQSRTSESTAQVTTSAKYCHACGTQIYVGSESCPKCGAYQAIQSNKNRRRRVTATLFAVFLGGLGIHKFYLGNIVGGLIYLLFCWTFIPSIISFIEGIYYLIISDSDFNRLYNR